MIKQSRIEQEGKAHADQQNNDRGLATVRRCGRPDLAVFQPVQDVHGNDPGYEGDQCFAYETKPGFGGFLHTEKISMIRRQ